VCALVRLSARDAVIEHQLRAAFDRVLKANPFVLGEEVECFEA
jgi:hypothetical protein